MSNRTGWKWVFPGIAVFMFATLLIALLQDFIPDTAQIFWSTTMGMLSYCIMLTLVLIGARPKGFEKKYGLTDMYTVHAWMAMALPITLLIHVGIRWSGWEYILDWDISPASKWGYFGFIPLILVMVTGIFVLSDTIIQKSEKLMGLKENFFNRKTHLWIHRLAIFSVIAIFFHVFNVNYLRNNTPFRLLIVIYTVGILGYWFIYRIRVDNLPEYEVIELNQPTPDIHEVVLRPLDGNRLDYQAGQYAFFRFIDSDLDSEPHPFSFSSSPLGDEETVSIMVKEDGDWTSSLGKVDIGDKVTIEGPYGNFYPEEVAQDESQPMVLLSGGIGVTPNLSVLREEIAKNSDRRIAFVWGLATKEDTMYLNEMRTLEEQFPNFSFHLIYSEEEVEGFPHGFVDDEFIRDEGLEKLYDTATWHVCGPGPMLDASKGLLDENDVTEEQAHIEEFAF